MLRSTFITRSIWYFRRQHLAIIAGTAISTAVLTGALVIGDSVRYSLEKIVDARLGNTKYVITGGSRFVSAELANRLSNSLGENAAAVLQLRGIAVKSETEERLNKINVLGIDSNFYKFSQTPLPVPLPGEAIISESTSKKLNLKQGDQFILRLEDASLIPVNSPFSRPAESSKAMRLKVSRIANDENLGRFSLQNNQSLPCNIFVSREYLAEKMEFRKLANIILIGNKEGSKDGAGEIYNELHKNWKLLDAGLLINTIGETGFFEVSSNRIFIDNAIIAKIDSLHKNPQFILTYLANSLRIEQKHTPYSFVTAAGSTMYPEKFPDNGIVINRWLADDLDAKTGDTLSMDYYIIGPLRKLYERNNKFIISVIIPTSNSELFRSLMPTFPGLSDAGSCRDWNSGIPIDLKLIRDRDEDYWNKFRGSPKAFIRLNTGKEIWKNSFGSLTAIRFREKEISADALEQSLMAKLEPSDIGISVVDLYAEGKSAASNSVDFGTLFLSLSFFVIVASLLLTILLYSLNTQSRETETALIAGLGFSSGQIIRLRITESLPAIFFGGILGSLLGIMYCQALLSGLNSVWHDAVRLNQLTIKVFPQTLTYGSFSGMILALISIFFVTKRSLRSQVAGAIKSFYGIIPASSKRKSRLHVILALSGISISLLILAYSLVSGSLSNAALFLTSGAFFLLGTVSALSAISAIRAGRQHTKQMDILSLAVSNSRRHTSRSYAIILIMSLGIFSLVLTGAYRKTYFGESKLPGSGTGGYQLWVETTIPFPFNLNSASGREKLILEDSSDLDSVHFIQLHSVEGDDASCLNLNQVRRPRILGVPADLFNQRKSFSFVNTAAGISREHSWEDLVSTSGDMVYNAFADATVIQYGLQKALGDTLKYLNESGKTLNFRISAGLDNSIFQGNLLVEDSLLTSQFPAGAVSTVMLVDVPEWKIQHVAGILKNSLQDYGIEITSASERLAEFNSVENTYLTVFLALGGLGMIIGTLGLGILLFRTILERRHEFALLQAIGFSKIKIMLLIILEYSFLLISGMICGIFSAIIAIFPSLVSPAFHIEYGFVATLLFFIFISGSIWIFVPSLTILKSSLIPALRNE